MYFLKRIVNIKTNKLDYTWTSSIEYYSEGYWQEPGEY